MLQPPRARRRRGLLWGVLSLAATGCIPYRPAPLDPAGFGTAFTARRLADSGLARFLGAHGVAPTDTAWRPRDLGLVAVFFHPALDESRGALAAARGAEVTAGMRPQSSAGVSGEYATATTAGASPWTVSLSAGIGFEGGGKRGARIARARALSLAAGLGLRAAAWRVALDAHQAAVAALNADGDVADARAEDQVLSDLLQLVRARYQEGSVSLADLAQVEAELLAAVVVRAQAERARTAARSALAGTLALPVDEALRVTIVEDVSEACAVVDTLDAGQLQALALRRRDDVGAALAEYAAAEGDVRLEVARQYPDLRLQPAIIWDQGVLKWALGFGLPALAFNRNQGPILEAEARRAAGAARFEGLQQSVSRDAAAARAGCASARREIAAVDSLVRGAKERLRIAQAAYARGETGATQVEFARLALVRGARARRAARRELDQAGVTLERALGGWLSGPSLTAADIERSPRSSETRP